MFSATAIVFLLQFVVGANVEGRISIAGTHDPVSVASVHLEKLGFPVLDIVAHNGRFQLRELAAGRYTITVAAPGFETYTSEMLLPDDSFMLIQLEAKDAAQGRQGGQSTPLTQTLGRFFRKLFR